MFPNGNVSQLGLGGNDNELAVWLCKQERLNLMP